MPLRFWSINEWRACFRPSSRSLLWLINQQILFHIKCAKAWLYYNLESTLVTTFSGIIVGDGGWSYLPWDMKKFRSISWWWTRDRHSIGCDHSPGDSLVHRLYMILLATPLVSNVEFVHYSNCCKVFPSGLYKCLWLSKHCSRH